MMMCIYAYIVNQLAGLQQIRTHWSLLGPINTSLSHLFVHAAVNQAMHTTTHNMQCNAAVFFFTVRRAWIHAYVRACWSLDACMLVWAGPGERCILFLDPCNENNHHACSRAFFNSFGRQHMHACMHAGPTVSGTSRGRSHCQQWQQNTHRVLACQQAGEEKKSY